MSSLPFLIAASILFVAAGAAMVATQIAGGFILIPIGIVFGVRAIFVGRRRR